MFMLSSIEEHIRIEPSQLGVSPVSAVENQIQQLFFDKVIPDAGLVVSLYDVTSITGGDVHTGDGGAHFTVQFRLVVFRPFKGEVLLGHIHRSSPCVAPSSMAFAVFAVPQHVIQTLAGRRAMLVHRSWPMKLPQTVSALRWDFAAPCGIPPVPVATCALAPRYKQGFSLFSGTTTRHEHESGAIKCSTACLVCREGITVSLGFTTDVVIPEKYMQTPGSSFDAAAQQWQWVYEDEPLPMPQGATVRFRVRDITFPPLVPGAQASHRHKLCARSAGLRRRQKFQQFSARAGVSGRGGQLFQPLLIVGDIDGDGLGCVDWWDAADADDDVACDAAPADS